MRSSLVVMPTILALGTAQWAVAQHTALPASEATVGSRLDASPRHGEWVAYDAGEGDSVKAWVVFPERSDPAPVVVVIHEIFGLSDWIRGVTDQLAADGFIAIAPDLLTGKGPDGGGTESVDRQAAIRLVLALDPDEVVRRLNGAAHYAMGLPAATSVFAVIGYCWGGSTSFRFATAQPRLAGAVVFYGTSPDSAALSSIQAPVLGLYGGDDARVTTTIPPAEREMRRLGKRYEREIYEGAGHGFLRAQEDRDGANQRATERAWPRAIAFLREVTRR